MLLMLMSPESIVDFCKANPIKWAGKYKPEVGRGGKGDIKSPTPAADMFFRCLKERHGELMTQKEYWEYCTESEEWAEWYKSQDLYVRQCFSARLYVNFYPSFIDSLHVWALLGTRYTWDGKHVFDSCVIDTEQDVVKKVDLTLRRQNESIRVALTTDSKANKRVNEYKEKYRGNSLFGTIKIEMPMKRPRQEGNKRWHWWPDDFEPIFRKAEQLWLPF